MYGPWETAAGVRTSDGSGKIVAAVPPRAFRNRPKQQPYTVVSSLALSSSALKKPFTISTGARVANEFCDLCAGQFLMMSLKWVVPAWLLSRVPEP